MTVLTSWDDGTNTDFRVADLLSKHGLPGIFFIPSNSPLSEVEIRELGGRFQIGGHTENHPEDMKLLTAERQFDEISLNKAKLEQILQHPITAFAYPSGRYDDTTVMCVRDAGFSWARTTYGGNTRLPDDLYRTHPTFHFRADRYPDGQWLQEARRLLADATVNGYFHLWGHSEEVERFGTWSELDTLLGDIAATLRSTKP